LLSSISFLCDDQHVSDAADQAEQSQPGRPPSLPRTARERARAEITGEILAAARGYLATDGAPALSLRAIARDLGMASSALYRYFKSRDDLLTRLIIDAYDSLGAAAETAEAAVDRGDLAGRFAAICHAVRTWALAHPNEYALIYGSPVPGYVAPPDTVAPASRVTTRLMWIIIDAAAAGRVPAADTQASEDPEAGPEVGRAAAALAPIRSYLPPGIPSPLIQRALMVWTGLFGVISFELYGQLHQVVGEEPADRDTFFAECIRRWLDFMNLG
jgi:AcrR family transcriptional regulator